MGAALLLNMICSIKIKKTTTKGVVVQTEHIAPLFLFS
jgi:hypothetical protein